MAVQEEETGTGLLARRRTRSRHPPTLAVETDSPDAGKPWRSDTMAGMSTTPDSASTSAPAPDSLAGLGIEDFIAYMPEGMGRLNEKMGVELVEISAERVVATMPVEGNTQPFGLLHGGASVVLAETLGSVGSAIHAYPDKVAVGVDINATHHRSATSGTLTGVASAIHLGRTSTSYEIVITDERGKRVCTSRITCALVQLPQG